MPITKHRPQLQFHKRRPKEIHDRPSRQAKGDRIGQGKENVRQYLREHKAMAQEIEAQIRAKLLTVAAPSTRVEEDSDEI